MFIMSLQVIAGARMHSCLCTNSNWHARVRVISWITSRRVVFLFFVQALQTSFSYLFADFSAKISKPGHTTSRQRFVKVGKTSVFLTSCDHLHQGPDGPDVWGKNYAWSSDIWSMGCILYEMCARTKLCHESMKNVPLIHALCNFPDFATHSFELLFWTFRPKINVHPWCLFLHIFFLCCVAGKCPSMLQIWRLAEWWSRM